MASVESRNKTLHYKRAVFLNPTSGHLTLAKYLDAALSSAATPMKRKEVLGEAGESVRMINKCYTHGTLVCGRFLDFTDGASQAVLELLEDVDELPIKHMSPNAKEQFLEGVLTFGIRDNHLVLVQSKGLKAAHLEKHLNWLLRDLTAVMPAEMSLALEDAPKREVTEKLLNVDWIELRTPIQASIFTAGTGETPKGIRGGFVAQIRSAVNVAGTFLERLQAEEALQVDDVELSLMIRRVGRRHTGRHSMLDEIAHSLRSADDIDFTLKTKDAEYHAGELKLRADVRIKLEPGSSMVDLKDAAEKMQEWLAEQITSRRVEA